MYPRWILDLFIKTPLTRFLSSRNQEIFFRDNPDLINKTIFLAEGYPADQLVSVRPLIEAEPHPSDKLIQEVIGTFLITGYMAYEWKHQQGIPIVGTEDEWLYFMSRDFETIFREDPTRVLGTLKFKNGRDVDITYENMAGLSYLLRNKRISRTLLDKKRHYGNPMLFVGFGHLFSEDEEIMAYIRGLASHGVMGPFREYARAVEEEAEHKGIAQYLIEAGIGFNYLNPRMVLEASNRSKEYYLRLFQSQRQGEQDNRRQDGYRQYVGWLLSQRKGKLGVTTKPSPEAAAQYIKALKDGVIYESKPTVKKGGWFHISKDKVSARLGKDTIWDKSIVAQGSNYEKLRGANLASNCPVIDHYDMQSKSVISLKTMDLRGESYEDQEEIDYIIGRYIEDLSEFMGINWTPPGAKEPIILRTGEDFIDKYLEIAIPVGSVTETQRAKLKKLQEYAASVDVILNIVEVA